MEKSYQKMMKTVENISTIVNVLSKINKNSVKTLK